MQFPSIKEYPSLQPVHDVPLQIAQFGKVERITEHVTHDAREEDPGSDVEPAGHDIHTLFELAPGVLDHVPALQFDGIAYPVDGEYVPGGFEKQPPQHPDR